MCYVHHLRERLENRVVIRRFASLWGIPSAGPPQRHSGHETDHKGHNDQPEHVSRQDREEGTVGR